MKMNEVFDDSKEEIKDEYLSGDETYKSSNTAQVNKFRKENTNYKLK